MFKRTLLTLTLLLFTAPQPASAQGTSGSASSLSSSIFKLMSGVNGSPAPATGGVTTPGKSPAATPAPVVKPQALNFKVTPEVRRKVIDTFVGGIAQASPEAGEELKKGLDGVDVFGQVAGEMRAKYGLSSTNLADVWALYWSYAWLMTRGRTDDPTRAQIVGLRDQFRPLLLAIPSVTGLSDAQKQEMAESLLLQTVLFGILAEGWKDDPASFKEFGQGLQQGTADLGLDLGRVELTDRGFVASK